MINKFIFGSILLISVSYFGQQKPFATLKFDKVILYDFSGGKSVGTSIIDEKGNLSRTIIKKVVLDEETTKILSKKLESKESYGGGTASCFEPHLGIVYYLKSKPIAHVSICLDCNRLSSSKNIPNQNQGKTGNDKDAYYLLDGMSNQFRKYLNGLLKKYNFSHQIKE